MVQAPPFASGLGRMPLTACLGKAAPFVSKLELMLCFTAARGLPSCIDLGQKRHARATALPLFKVKVLSSHSTTLPISAAALGKGHVSIKAGTSSSDGHAFLGDHKIMRSCSQYKVPRHLLGPLLRYECMQKILRCLG